MIDSSFLKCPRLLFDRSCSLFQPDSDASRPAAVDLSLQEAIGKQLWLSWKALMLNELGSHRTGFGSDVHIKHFVTLAHTTVSELNKVLKMQPITVGCRHNVLDNSLELIIGPDTFQRTAVHSRRQNK